MEKKENIVVLAGVEYDLSDATQAIQALCANQGLRFDVASRIPRDLVSTNPDINTMMLICSDFKDYNYIDEGLKNYISANESRYVREYQNNPHDDLTPEERESLEKASNLDILLLNISTIVDDYFAQKNNDKKTTPPATAPQRGGEEG